MHSTVIRTMGEVCLNMSIYMMVSPLRWINTRLGEGYGNYVSVTPTGKQKSRVSVNPGLPSRVLSPMGGFLEEEIKVIFRNGEGR